MPQGVGRRRRIELPKDFTPPALRVKILHYQETDRTLSYVLDLQHELMEAGHSVGFASRNLLDLGMDAKRVARMVKETETDAWVVFAGPREVLEWFASQPVPSFAMFGRRSSVPIAGTGPDKLPALLMAVRRLVALGHRKIVMLLREEHRKPQPGPFARAFLDELKSNGLSTGSYNLPDWEDSGDGFRRCLDSLFQSTPPSALILSPITSKCTTCDHFKVHHFGWGFSDGGRGVWQGANWLLWRFFLSVGIFSQAQPVAEIAGVG